MRGLIALAVLWSGPHRQMVSFRAFHRRVVFVTPIRAEFSYNHGASSMTLRAPTSLLLFLVGVLLVARAADGQVVDTSAAPDIPRDESPVSAWSIDDLLLQETATEFQISPDGRYVVWIRSQMDPEE